MARYFGVWLGLLVAGSAVLFVGAEVLSPGPVVALLAGATWAVVAHSAATVYAARKDWI